MLEDHEVDRSRLPEPFASAEVDAGYVVQGVHVFLAAGFYSEWDGYGETRFENPGAREFTGDVLGWAQTDYPGPARGYDDHWGYAVEEFRENDYDTGPNRGGGR